MWSHAKHGIWSVVTLTERVDSYMVPIFRTPDVIRPDHLICRIIYVSKNNLRKNNQLEKRYTGTNIIVNYKYGLS